MPLIGFRTTWGGHKDNSLGYCSCSCHKLHLLQVTMTDSCIALLYLSVLGSVLDTKCLSCSCKLASCACSQDEFSHQQKITQLLFKYNASTLVNLYEIQIPIYLCISTFPLINNSLEIPRHKLSNHCIALQQNCTNDELLKDFPSSCSVLQVTQWQFLLAGRVPTTAAIPLISPLDSVCHRIAKGGPPFLAFIFSSSFSLLLHTALDVSQEVVKEVVIFPAQFSLLHQPRILIQPQMFHWRS